MHRAFAPEMTPSAYCRPKRIITGWIAPDTKLKNKGNLDFVKKLTESSQKLNEHQKGTRNIQKTT